MKCLKSSRRQFLNLATGAIALPLVPPLAKADAYPSRPVRIIVGFGPGVTPDISARLMAQRLSERLGQQFVVENRIGGAGNIGTELVIKAAPDGHTLLLITTANAINASLYDHLNFNFIRDIAPVAGISRAPLVVAINPALPAKTIAELITYAKANPGKINMASAGDGTIQHVAGELFKMMAAVDMVHVPYRSSYVPDLLSGQVQIVFNPIPTLIGSIRSGQLRALAVTSAQRTPALSDVPTVSEIIPGYEAVSWYGYGAPRNMPAERIHKLNAEINSALAEPAIIARLAELGAEPMMMTPADFGQHLADETEKWGKVVKAANIKVE